MEYAPLIVLFPLLGVIINGLFGKLMPPKLVGWIAALFIGASFVVAVNLAIDLANIDVPKSASHGHETAHHGGHGHDDHGHEAVAHDDHHAADAGHGCPSSCQSDCHGDKAASVNFKHERWVEVPVFNWLHVGNLSLDFAILVDPLSIIMMLVVTGISFLIHIYSIGYMHGDPRFRLFFVYLNLFVFFMLLLVTGNNYPILFIGWEGVGLCSYLLIGFWWEDMAKATAGMKAFVVNRIGDFGMLIAMFLIFSQLGTLTFSEVFPAAAAKWGGTLDVPVVTAIGLMLLLGAAGKSAQIPLYVWLPDAMAGPTPVSALIHAATMVTAGVYMIARSNVLFMLSPTAMAVVAFVGALTAIVAATIGIKQYDIKKVLAYSTVSQLGYMVMACGVGAFTAGVFHLMTHAFFKALLFLGSGAVIHTMHGALHHIHDHHTDPQDMRNMGGLRKYIPVTYWVFLIATIAIAGIPGFSGFFSKDEILAMAFAKGLENGNMIPWVFGLLAAVITAFYMFRLVFLTFFGDYKGPKGSDKGLHESPPVMTIPLMVLAVLSIIGGYIGLPPVLSKVHHLHDWLNPVFEPGREVVGAHVAHLPHSTEWILIGISVFAAILGISIAYNMYIARKKVGDPDSEQKGIEKLLWGKYFIDELYNTVIIQPLIRICRFLWKIVDAGMIDSGMVLGTAKTVRSVGGVLRKLQTGVVGNYALMLAAGIILVLAMIMVR